MYNLMLILWQGDCLCCLRILLEQDLDRCKWLLIQCDESVDHNDAAQLAVFIRMVFGDFRIMFKFKFKINVKMFEFKIQKKNVRYQHLVNVHAK